MTSLPQQCLVTGGSGFVGQVLVFKNLSTLDFSSFSHRLLVFSVSLKCSSKEVVNA